jgi:hypothetical protein
VTRRKKPTTVGDAIKQAIKEGRLDEFEGGKEAKAKILAEEAALYGENATEAEAAAGQAPEAPAPEAPAVPVASDQMPKQAPPPVTEFPLFGSYGVDRGLPPITSVPPITGLDLSPETIDAEAARFVNQYGVEDTWRLFEALLRGRLRETISRASAIVLAILGDH